MAFQIIDDESIVAGGFKVEALTGSKLIGDEKLYAEAIGRLMGVLADDAYADPAADDPTGAAERDLRRTERGEFLKMLRAEAEEVAAGRLDPEAAVDRAFVHRGRYVECQLRRSSRLFNVYEQSNKRGIPTNVIISVASDGPGALVPPTEEQQSLFVALENVRTIVSTVADRIEKAESIWLRTKRSQAREAERANALRKRFLRDLVEIARVGLEGRHPQLAKLALDTFKSEFVASEAGRIKNGYVRSLGMAAAIAASLALAIHFAIILAFDASDPQLRYRIFFAAAAGAAVGTWLSFSIRRVTLTFEELAVIEEDLLDPSLRVLFVVLLTTIVMLLFWTGIMNLEIGLLKTGGLGDPHSPLPMGAIAFLIGAFCGMSERALATAVSGRAAAFVKTVAP